MRSWILVLVFIFATQAKLIINEFDYGDKDFVEIYNSDNSVSYDLNLYRLVIISGNQIIFNLQLPTFTLSPNRFFLICGNSQKLPKYASMCDWDLALTSAFVSQSSPSAVAIRNTADTIIDTVSYKGSTNGWTELNSAGLDDNGYFIDVGFSRWPNGIDTNNNNIDFRLTCITPGSYNTNDTDDCSGKISKDNQLSSIGPTIGILAAIFIGVIFVVFVFFILINGIRNKIIRSTKGDDIEMASVQKVKERKRDKSKDESDFKLIHSSGKTETSGGKAEITSETKKDELSSTSSDSESESSSKRSRSDTQTSLSSSGSGNSNSSGSKTEEEGKEHPVEEPKKERKVSIYEDKKEVEEEKKRKSSEAIQRKSSSRALLQDPSKQGESEVDQSKEKKDEEKKETKEEKRERRLSRKSSSFAVVEPVKNTIQKSSSFDKESEKNEEKQENSNSPVSSPTSERKEKKRPSNKQKRAKEYATVTRVQADRLIEKWETISTTSADVGENKNSPKDSKKEAQK